MAALLPVLRVFHLLLVGYTLWLSVPLKPENVPRIQLSLPLILAGHGLIKQSLSASGAVAAFLVGYGKHQPTSPSLKLNLPRSNDILTVESVGNHLDRLLLDWQSSHQV